jgi:hypothetical protein
VQEFSDLNLDSRTGATLHVIVACESSVMDEQLVSEQSAFYRAPLEWLYG